MQQRRALGRGIESLIPPVLVTETPGEGAYRTVPIDQITPNRQQPRTIFDEEKIRELADSIRAEGVLQPLVVSPLPDGRYELIAGERRWRASRLAGLTDIPVVVKTVDEEGLLALSIVENIQREDLNPIEESRGYQELSERFNLSQEEIAKRVGKSRVAVANSLRLLKLPQVIQDDVTSQRYTAGHARALLGLPNIHEQLKAREHILRTTPTVRDVERLVAERSNGRPPRTRRSAALHPQHQALVERLRQSLGTKVLLKTTNGERGQLVVEFYSQPDLDRICRQILSV